MARKLLGTVCNKEELESMKLIRNKLTCATQALTPASLPPNVSRETIDQYVKSAIDAKAEAMFLEEDWWRSMGEKYKFNVNTQNVYLDFGTGEFYLEE